MKVARRQAISTTLGVNIRIVGVLQHMNKTVLTFTPISGYDTTRYQYIQESRIDNESIHVSGSERKEEGETE